MRLVKVMIPPNLKMGASPADPDPGLDSIPSLIIEIDHSPGALVVAHGIANTVNRHGSRTLMGYDFHYCILFLVFIDIIFISQVHNHGGT